MRWTVNSQPPCAGLGPFENVVIVQQLTGALEVIGLHRRPEALDHMSASLCLVHHEDQCIAPYGLTCPINGRYLLGGLSLSIKVRCTPCVTSLNYTTVGV